MVNSYRDSSCAINNKHGIGKHARSSDIVFRLAVNFDTESFS